MSDDFQQLLDATILHLEQLKAQGRRFVAADPDALHELSKPVSAQPVISAPTRTAPAIISKPTTAIKTTPKTVSTAPTSAGGAKEQSLNELRERTVVCTRCPHLVKSRKQVVFGVGSATADLMFVGEAPGADEDAQGEPFVGRAGQLLTRIIETMGLSRDTVYIGNILKCRPDMPTGESGNRKPTSEEMETCSPWLLEQIAIIQPKVMVAVGATAVEGLIGGTVKITHMRGQWKEFNGIPLMPTLHPSYLLRGNDPAKKRMVWEDMLQVMEKLGMPISEKQRGFFLKK